MVDLTVPNLAVLDDAALPRSEFLYRYTGRTFDVLHAARSRAVNKGVWRHTGS